MVNAQRPITSVHSKFTTLLSETAERAGVGAESIEQGAGSEEQGSGKKGKGAKN